jgi:hypothetical protein
MRRGTGILEGLAVQGVRRFAVHSQADAEVSASAEQMIGNYAASMAIREQRIAETREMAKQRAAAQRPAAKANRADALANRQCVVPDCKHVWHRGRLCRKHWRGVPMGRRFDVSIAAWDAQRKAADKVHRAIEREVVASVKATGRRIDTD